MVLICDNAPYHHKREIGSLCSRNKQQLVELMLQYDIPYIDLPITAKREAAYPDSYEDEVIEVLDEDGALFMYRVFFDEESFKKAATSAWIPNVDELKMGIMDYISRPANGLVHLVDCKVEGFLKERGHRIIWTPPYCPDLQPIETFWGCAKGWVAQDCENNRSMKQVVQLLRDAWYGYDGEERNKKNAVRCHRLIETSFDRAAQTFIPRVGFSGTVRDLIVPPNTTIDLTGAPIDILMNTICLGEDNEEEEAEEE
jgi:transposase